MNCEKCNSTLVNCYQSMMDLKWYAKCNTCKHEWIFSDIEAKEAKRINYHSINKDEINN